MLTIHEVELIAGCADRGARAAGSKDHGAAFRP